MQRPTLSHHLAAHPHDPARALDAYRAALAEWRREADPLPQRPPRWHPRAAAVALAAVVVAWLLLRAIEGCATAPTVGARECVEGCGREVDACLGRCGAGVVVDGGREEIER